jgi:hypothetical protein
MLKEKLELEENIQTFGAHHFIAQHIMSSPVFRPIVMLTFCENIGRNRITLREQ